MNFATEHVILVDELDQPIGTAEKLRAHTDGVLHRAFSVFVLNGKDELLLQRRAGRKYHSADLWSNTCCSHPRPGEPTRRAAHRRLKEEMGFDCALTYAFAFIYRVRLAENLWEHEYDHVYLGRFDGDAEPVAAEVADWRWVTIDAVGTWREREPADFTVWFRIAFRELLDRGRLLSR